MARKRTGSSLFYINHKNTTYEGYLYKKGKMVKSWRLRWFVLDLETKMVSENKNSNYCTLRYAVIELCYSSFV